MAFDTDTFSTIQTPQAGEAVDIALIMNTFKNSMRDRVLGVFASKAARDSATTALKTADASVIGMKAYVEDYGWCGYDGNTRSGTGGWTWFTINNVLAQNWTGIVAPPTTTNGSSQTIFPTFSTTLPGGQRLLQVDFKAVGFTTGMYPSIYGRIDLIGTNFSYLNAMYIPFHIPAVVQAGTEAVSDISLAATWRVKVTGAVSLTASVVKVYGGDKPYLKNALWTISDLGPCD